MSTDEKMEEEIRAFIEQFTAKWAPHTLVGINVAVVYKEPPDDTEFVCSYTFSDVERLDDVEEMIASRLAMPADRTEPVEVEKPSESN